MRVMIYPETEGQRTVTIVPGRRARMAPITIRGAWRDDVLAETAAVLDVVTRAELGDRAVPEPA